MKLQRLPAPTDLNAVFRRGTRTRRGPLTVVSVRTQTGQRRAGVVARAASGRLKSHERQRARRLLREIVRQHQHQLVSSVDLALVVTWTPARQPTYQELTTAFLAACANQHLLSASV